MDVDVRVDGFVETLGAIRSLETALRRQVNSELRTAAGESAQQLVGELRSAAVASGVPVAPRVAQTVRVKSDRLPAVTIGGTRKVGRHGARAAELLWGSERGSVDVVDRFQAAANPAGYWIAPTVDRFKRGPAVTIYRTQVGQILRRVGLV